MESATVRLILTQCSLRERARLPYRCGETQEQKDTRRSGFEIYRSRSGIGRCNSVL